MLFDWFTLVAQLINFLVLVWLLKRFLYRPVLNAIDTRERQVSDRLRQAQTLQAQADEQRALFTAKNAELAQRRETLLHEAENAAKAERERLLEQARQDAVALRAKQTDAWQRDTQVMARIIKQRTQQESLAIARKVLQELSGVTLEQRLVEAFIGKLQNLDASERTQLRGNLAGNAVVQVRSAFVLESEQRQQLTQAIQGLLAEPVRVEFGTLPDLLGGIELTTDGHKLAWNLGAFVDALDEELLKQTSTVR